MLVSERPSGLGVRVVKICRCYSTRHPRVESLLHMAITSKDKAPFIGLNPFLEEIVLSAEIETQIPSCELTDLVSSDVRAHAI